MKVKGSCKEMDSYSNKLRSKAPGWHAEYRSDDYCTLGTNISTP
jgi:hypothetical protein